MFQAIDFLKGFSLASLVLLYVLAGSTPVLAAEEEACNLDHFSTYPSDQVNFRVFKAKGSGNQRIYFVKEEAGCPSHSTGCRQKSYLVPGDEVVVERKYKDWTCSWFQNPQGAMTTGWLPTASLRPLAATSPSWQSWLGTWKQGKYNEIKISKGPQSGVLKVTGSALWQGLGDNVHTGEFNAQATPQGLTLRVRDGNDTYSCEVNLRLNHQYLLVKDNSNCGGMNVRFMGGYRKSGP